MSVSQAESQYATLDVIKKKLRIPDDTIDDELEIIISEVQDYMNRKIRRRLGYFNVYGDDIILPLTEVTTPPVTVDLKQIADDLCEGKFRLKTTNDKTLWEEAEKELEEHLDENFGWVEAAGYRVQPTLIVTPDFGPPSTLVTLSGTGFAVNDIVKITAAGIIPTTTPTTVVADSTGSISGVTFTIPATVTSPGSVDIAAFSNSILNVTAGKSNSAAIPPSVVKRFRVT